MEKPKEEYNGMFSGDTVWNLDPAIPETWLLSPDFSKSQ